MSFRYLLTFLIVFFLGQGLAFAETDEELRARGDDPRFVERIVDFMWVEGRFLWKDTFKARIYPRSPTVGRSARIRLKIRRTRDGKGKTPPAPLRIEATIRKEKSGGNPVVYTANNPEAGAAFEHAFEKPGRYVVSIKTFYTEEETYTVALRCTVQPEPEPEPEAIEEP